MRNLTYDHTESHVILINTWRMGVIFVYVKCGTFGVCVINLRRFSAGDFDGSCTNADWIAGLCVNRYFFRGQDKVNVVQGRP